jgi:hypothetical protein
LHTSRFGRRIPSTALLAGCANFQVNFRSAAHFTVADPLILSLIVGRKGQLSVPAAFLLRMLTVRRCVAPFPFESALRGVAALAWRLTMKLAANGAELSKKVCRRGCPESPDCVCCDGSKRWHSSCIFLLKWANTDIRKSSARANRAGHKPTIGDRDGMANGTHIRPSIQSISSGEAQRGARSTHAITFASAGLSGQPGLFRDHYARLFLSVRSLQVPSRISCGSTRKFPGRARHRRLQITVDRVHCAFVHCNPDVGDLAASINNHFERII